VRVTAQLLVAATDLNVSLTAELKSTNASEDGITLGAKDLHQLIANAPGSCPAYAAEKSSCADAAKIAWPACDRRGVPAAGEAQETPIPSAHNPDVFAIAPFLDFILL
jgi:hypothetical protein